MTQHAKDFDNWYPIVNLGLYHLVKGNRVESDRFYRSLLNAPKEMIEMGIKDLEEMREWRIANGELRIEAAIGVLKGAISLREAWPRVTGRTVESFSLASLERPPIER